uniref:TRAF2 and NCK interacting kinase n=1 Tax=Pavo cristatus TaxID=9049 RepID=A0A8C9L5H0_PAVCR
ASLLRSLPDPAGIFELVEVVGNGTYGQVYKVGGRISLLSVLLFCPDGSRVLHPDDDERRG